MESISSRPFVLLVPSPGLGHLIPYLELANSLVTHHSFQVTVVVISSNKSPEQSQVIQSAMTTKLFDIIELPPVEASSHVSAAGSVFTQLPAIMLDARSSLRSAIAAMELKPAAIIVDLFGTEVLTVADEFHMLKYVRVSGGWPLALLLYSPILDKEVEGEYLDLKEPLKIPGCKSVRPEDVVKPMMNRKDPEYGSFVNIGSKIGVISDGILVNTWEALEPTCIKAMREHPEWKRILKVPIYPFGPMIRPVGRSGPRSEVLSWLDMQPNESVIYISFGSGGVLSADQIIEMAWGLELSSQRFIWVVHPPRDGDKGKDISAYLPEGFKARTQDKGLVVTTWAPQMEILAHSSVGGFLSHVGWNSLLESIMNGVPMITWPLYAEQKMAATMLVEDLKVAIRLKDGPPNRVVKREEIEMAIRKTVDKEEGDAMRARARELKKTGETAISQGGSSFTSLTEIAKLCKINTQRQKVPTA